MNDSVLVASLEAELDRERTAHAETKLSALAMMEAVDIHVNQLRAVVETLSDEVARLRAIVDGKESAL